MHTASPSKTYWPLFPRKVSFDWTETPLHWIPQSPLSSHAINHFSFSLVRGEYFFCRMFNKALPFIHDEKLKADVQVFIRQEAIHAQAHKESIELYLQRYGVDIEKQYETVIQLFDHALADKPFGVKLPQFLQKQWLVARVGIVAAAEHYTCALGKFVLENAHWEEKGCNPEVSDLFTWHCAEEVEHRAVAYDLYQYLAKNNYAMRCFIMLMVIPAITALMVKGTVNLAATDPLMPKSQKRLIGIGFWKEWSAASQQNLIPSLSWFITTSGSFFKPDYHPIYEASTQMALDYINNSAAVKAFEQKLAS
ncbi:MAG: metal-dependent hydrolase [Acinetobacter sp.]